jgi:Tol biopolymer transport system component
MTMGVTVTTCTTPPPHRARRGLTALAALGLAATASIAAAPSPAGAVVAGYTTTSRVSVTSTGAEATHSPGDVVALSGDGRFVAFSSDGALTFGDTGGHSDAYVRDRLGGTTTRVSLTDGDTQIGGPSSVCALSRDGRFVAFVGQGTGLPVPGSAQVYVRDRWERTTTLVSVSSGEVPSSVAPGNSGISTEEECAISDDGRYVAFESEDGDLAASASHDGDVYRRDVQNGTTQLVNAAMVSGAEPNGGSWDVDISANGQTVAFSSEANNLVASDTNGKADVFVRSFATSTTHRMSVKAGGGQVLAWSEDPTITADGNRVAFTSGATDLVADDTNGMDDVFVRNRQTDTVVRASLGPSGELERGGARGRISDDGRFVAFSHWDPDAVPPTDLNQDDDVLRRDLQAGTTTYSSIAKTGWTGSEQSYHPAISGDGLVVGFVSYAHDLVFGDNNSSEDVFVRDHFIATTPFATRAALVHQQYLDFLGRAPTNAEKTAWEERLANGEVVPEQVIDELAHSTAWAGKRAPVIRLYWAFFLRVPDKPGMDYWIGEANKGLSLPKMASKFAQSQEFKTEYGPLSNSAFVTAIYQNVFDRDPEPAGLAYWKGQLDSGAKTRGDVMVGFSESAEGRLLLSPAVDSVLVWLGMLRTVPPSSWSIDGLAEVYSIGEPPEIIPEAILERTDYADRVS